MLLMLIMLMIKDSNTKSGLTTISFLKTAAPNTFLFAGKWKIEPAPGINPCPADQEIADGPECVKAAEYLGHPGEVNCRSTTCKCLLAPFEGGIIDWDTTNKVPQAINRYKTVCRDCS